MTSIIRSAIFTKTGAMDTRVTFLTPTPPLPPKSWILMQPITYKVTTLTDNRVTIVNNNNNELTQFLFKGYTRYPLIDIINTQKLPTGANQAKIYITKNGSTVSYLTISPSNSEIDLIHLNQEGNLLRWFNGVLLIQN
jgi:hypothetical protein